MSRFFMKFALSGSLYVLLSSQAMAQERVLFMPVFSMEAAAVNNVSIGSGPVNKVTVAPGDVITAKIFVRNWSPDGQKMRAYQVKMDPEGYRSGSAGTVQPVGHNPGTNNDANAFIDINDPAFVHKGLQSIPLTDSASDGYRWLNVLINTEESPASAQDGKKYYCATLKLQASADASGTFKIGVVEEPKTSGLLDPENNEILPMGYESLTVEVRSDVRWLRIESSDPPSGAIDGRLILSSAGKSDPAWRTIRLVFNADSSTLKPQDLTVEDGTGTPPKITGIQTTGSEAIVTLDRAISAGAWTTITHSASGSFTRVGRLPGDVSNDGRTDAEDLLVLIRGLNGLPPLPGYRGDLDASGDTNSRDVLRFIDLITDKHPNRTRLPK